MNAFTKTSLEASDLIDVVFFRKGLIPQTFTCGCCGDETDETDHMSGEFTRAHTEAVVAAHGPMVCFACADDFTPEETGEYVNPDEAYDLMAEDAA